MEMTGEFTFLFHPRQHQWVDYLCFLNDAEI